MIGKTISHYRIVEKLGKGGMSSLAQNHNKLIPLAGGEVYKAEDTKLKRTVVLRFVPPELTRDPATKALFIQEVQAASALDHRNICTIHEISETEDGQLFIVIAYYDGERLNKKVAHGQMAVDSAIDIAIQIAQGLAKAHAHGLIHRDIKPASVMITKAGMAKILHFGFARLEDQQGLSRAGATIGTIAYMSPEQAQGEEVDHRTDIWSFGVVLYEMLTGQLPFKGEYQQAVIYSILNEPPPSVSSLRPKIPQQLERIVNLCLEKKATDRYQQMSDLLADLRSLQPQSESGVTRPGHAKASRQRRTLTYVFSAVLVVLALLVGYFLFQPRTASIERKSIAVLPFHPITKSEEDQNFCEGIHDDILTQLSKISDLKVIARTSVMRYQETQKSLKEIARELGVGTVLEGSTRRSGNTIRVTAQLIAADTEEHLWGDTYDRSYTDIFAIQSDVAQKIAAALQARLAQEELRTIQAPPTENLLAYEFFKKGKYFWENSFDLEGNLEAAEMFEQACQLDSTFVLAYAWQSICYSTVYVQMPPSDIKNVYRLKSEQALTRAASLASDMAEVYLARGYYYDYIKRDVSAAIKESEIAYVKRPKNPEILRFMALLLRAKGDYQKSLTLNEKIYQLDPKGAEPLYASGNAFILGRYADAIRWLDILIANFPDDVTGYVGKIEFTLTGFGDIGRAEAILKEAKNFVTKGKNSLLLPEFHVYFYKRDYGRALATLLESKDEKYFLSRAILLKLMNRPGEAKTNFDSARIDFSGVLSTMPNNGSARLSLAIAYAGLGERTRALQELVQVDSMAQRGQGLNIAYFYILIGDNESALRHLEKCIADPSEATAYQLRLDPFLDPLKSEPRFDKVIQKAENRYKNK